MTIDDNSVITNPELRTTFLFSLLSIANRKTASYISKLTNGDRREIIVVIISVFPNSDVVNVNEYNGTIINCINLLPKLPIAKIIELLNNFLYLFMLNY